MTAYTHGERVKEQMMIIGLQLMRETGNASMRAIGRKMGYTHQAVLYHWGSAEALYNAIAEEAVRTGDELIIPRLIVAKHPAVAELTDADRARFLS